MDIIVNPTAGRGKGARSLAELQKDLDSEGVRYRVHRTESQGHAVELGARIARSGGKRLVVVGGDGTIGEVVNGIKGSSIELGIVSVGTGNDIARSLGIPFNDVKAAYRVLSTGEVRTIDVGVDGKKLFVSALGIGFPVVVANEANRMARIGGKTAFFLSVHKALHRMRPFPARIALDGQVLEMDCTSILVQNTPFTGGGLRVAPQARLDDGLLDVVVIGAVGRLELMLNFPRVYSGRHSTHPAFHVFRSQSVQVTSSVTLEKISDGDPSGLVPVEARVSPGALRVLLPSS